MMHVVKGRQYCAYTVYIDGSIAEMEYETGQFSTLIVISFNASITERTRQRSTASELQINRGMAWHAACMMRASMLYIAQG